MIEAISIAGTASYGINPQTLPALSKFNFVFGSNGTGKTTISRLISDETSYPTCKLTWRGGLQLQSMVYNRDFVVRNFDQCGELKGVFTLGEKNVDTVNQIAAAKKVCDSLTERIEGLRKNLIGDDGLGGKKGELAALEDDIKRTCWSQKQKHDAKLFGAFEGFRGNAEKFKSKVFLERASNAASIYSLEDLERKADALFGSTPTPEQALPPIGGAAIVGHESNPILAKRVVGKEDVDIAAMIKKLGNSDWVREGRAFYEANALVCPFCQQTTTDSLSRSLNEYFDETFADDTRAIEELARGYEADSIRIQQQAGSVIAAPSRFLELEKLQMEKELLDSKITINIQRIASKRKEPSQIVELESLISVVTAITNLIKAANVQVDTHNKMVANLAQERRDLTAQVWRLVIEELSAPLAAYDAKRSGLTKAIEEMEAKSAAAERERATKNNEIRALEKTTSSIQPTIDDINALLGSFGFSGFLLAKAGDGTCYKLVRLDGTDAKETLSEGEKTFVTFLYFYHLLKGSDSEAGITTDRVVVFDDPVCSLDSDILFIVGSLIKGLFAEVRLGVGHVKQLFVLTHNVYFHKEVTFNPQFRNFGQNDVTYSVIRKTGSESTIQKHSTNPIRTSYELLWMEVRKPDRTNLSIQNTLRRILENYFKILGGWDSERICDLFTGREKLVCNSLYSWINDGSHSALDDLYTSTDPSIVESYLHVFRAIFQKTGHIEHYRMMMAEAYVEEDTPGATGDVPLDQVVEDAALRG